MASVNGSQLGNLHRVTQTPTFSLPPSDLTLTQFSNSSNGKEGVFHFVTKVLRMTRHLITGNELLTMQLLMFLLFQVLTYHQPRALITSGQNSAY